MADRKFSAATPEGFGVRLGTLGARLEGVLRRHMVVREERVRGTVRFAIAAEVRPRVRGALEARLAARGA